jgi:hypothetical protein
MEQTIAAQRPAWENLTESGDGRQLRGKPDWTDLLFFVVLAAGAAYALTTYTDSMDIYEKWILVGTVPFVVWCGWLWRPLRTYIIASGLTALFAIWLYDGNLANADTNFFLKYFVSSQSAVLWMCMMYLVATVLYWVGFVSTTAAWLGTVFTWGGDLRWHRWSFGALARRPFAGARSWSHPG